MYALCKIRQAVWVLMALALWVLRSAAQLEIGDDVKLNMNGTVGFGYGGSFGDPGESSHSLNMTGQGTLSDSFYSPSFLSFTVQPYYNRDQNNSESQSIFDESGVVASANLFGDSHFPGSVSYGKNFNSMRDRSSPLPQPSLLPSMLGLDGITAARAMGVRILCTDCHNSDDNREFGGIGPNGPHGSKFTHILERRYEINTATAPGRRPAELLSESRSERKWSVCFVRKVPRPLLGAVITRQFPAAQQARKRNRGIVFRLPLGPRCLRREWRHLG